MSVPKDIIAMNPGLGDYCALHVYRGSISHGMYIPNSDPDSIDDKDTMAICVPPSKYYFGLDEFYPRGTKEIKYREWDIVVYEARKAIRLLEQGNPNVLSMLWSEQEDYITLSEGGRYLINNRELFVGRHVYQSFTGYAYSQLHKMESHTFEGYMGEKRKALVEKFGYDTKNAAHLIRLLRMGIEFLTDGTLYVRRRDAQQLIEIKRGMWTLERVKKEADRLFIITDEAYIKSKLPAKPNHEKINELCVNLVAMKA